MAFLLVSKGNSQRSKSQQRQHFDDAMPQVGVNRETDVDDMATSHYEGLDQRTIDYQKPVYEELSSPQTIYHNVKR